MICGSIFGCAESVFSKNIFEQGKKVFNKCRSCHSLTSGVSKIGPSLHGIFERRAGTWRKKNGKLYRYSTVLKNAGQAPADKRVPPLIWNKDTLNKFLEAPRKYLPGNKMSFTGLKKPKDRETLILFLKKATK
tara:strand:- start:786 stop:1184 length:399 start_codon:yes stop_codon:yes gene_type:complete